MEAIFKKVRYQFSQKVKIEKIGADQNAAVRLERTRKRQNSASCTRTWPVTVGSAINAFRAVLMALVDAMCEFPAATSSDSDEGRVSSEHL